MSNQFQMALANFRRGETVSVDQNQPSSSDKVGSELLKSLIKAKRTHFSIEELTKAWDCNEEALFDLAMQSVLVFSAPAAGWRIQRGKITVLEGVEQEVVEDDRVVTEMVSLPNSAIIPLMKMKACVVEQLWAPPGHFARVIGTESVPLPNLLLANVKITAAAAEEAIRRLTHGPEDAKPVPEPLNSITEAVSAYTPLTTDAIAKLFKLEKDDAEEGDKANRLLWRDYAHHAKRNGLDSARAPRPPNEGRKQSYFYPDMVGDWLVTKGIKPRQWVENQLERYLAP
jgi:hypothetical protein